MGRCWMLLGGNKTRPTERERHGVLQQGGSQGSTFFVLPQCTKRGSEHNIGSLRGQHYHLASMHPRSKLHFDWLALHFNVLLHLFATSVSLENVFEITFILDPVMSLRALYELCNKRSEARYIDMMLWERQRQFSSAFIYYQSERDCATLSNRRLECWKGCPDLTQRDWTQTCIYNGFLECILVEIETV